MSLDLTSLADAVATLQGAVEEAESGEFMDPLTPRQSDLVRAGVIQNFEFTYELCWKFMRRRLREDIGDALVDGISRRELFRLAAEQKLIEDAGVWFVYHEARNRTSHTYDAAVAKEVYAATLDLAKDAATLLANLRR